MQRPVVILSPLFPPRTGGLADHTHGLALALARRADVRVLTGTGGSRIPDVPVFPDVGNWGDARELASHLDHCPPGTLRLWQYVPHMYGRGGVNRMLPGFWRRQRQEGHHQVVLMHEIAAPWGWRPHHWWYAWNHRRQWRAVLGTANLIPVSTGAWVEEWGRRRPDAAERMFTVASPSNIPRTPVAGDHREAWRRSRGWAEDLPVIVWFGSVSAAKQVDWVYEAWRRSHDEGFPVGLVVVGGDPGVGVDPGLRRFLLVTGFLDAGGVSEVFQAADLMALPFVDGASERRTTLTAALAHGLPVVSTDGHNTGTAIRRGGYLALSPAGSRQGFVQLVNGILRDPVRRRDLGRAGFGRYQSELGWDAVADRLVDRIRRAGLDGSPG